MTGSPVPYAKPPRNHPVANDRERFFLARVMLSSSIAPRPCAREGLTRIAGQLAQGRYLDAILVAVLLLLTGALLLPACGRFPMELWDESRNANNAIEMA